MNQEKAKERFIRTKKGETIRENNKGKQKDVPCDGQKDGKWVPKKSNLQSAASGNAARN